MAIDYEKLSPMMRQYFEVKDKYPDHILFYRIGDFYEMFFDDALIGSKVLDLTLTGRDCGLEERAPMCGIPHHAAEIYVKRLVEAGYTVAICEQLTDPALSKGIVERDVIKIVTPGTLTESSMLDEGSNNYICAAYVEGEDCAICFADISTGEASIFLKFGKDIETDIIDELSRFEPSEILYNEPFTKYKEVARFIEMKMHTMTRLISEEKFDICNRQKVLKQFNVDSMWGLDIEPESTEERCLCGLFDYISDTQKALAGRFTGLKVHRFNNFMSLDMTARKNLELTETLRNKERKGSLIWVLDQTKTSMGKRMLKKWLEQPLTKPTAIMARLDAVEQLCRYSVSYGEIIDELSGVYDLERLMTRVVYRSSGPKDVKILGLTLKHIPHIKEELSKLDKSPYLTKLNGEIDALLKLEQLIENAIVDDPSVSAKDGGFIKDGFSSSLDELRAIVNGGKQLLSEIEEKERKRTGISKLKIGYNRVFGYYLEVTKSNLGLVPADYIRKQTLANCERYVTEDLKEAENKIATAGDKVLQMEQDMFEEICGYIESYISNIQRTANALAELDVICSFAGVAMKNQYTKPEIAIDGAIEIKDGRHPVVEAMSKEEIFVPNDTYLNTGSTRMAVITGPNMSGKSTYMRQVALITLMAQIGSFVPASYARISVVDKIFTRVGASDDLTAGQSTFMVEMSEVANILKHATKNSLVILDEVGRGTSTFDGISIARSVAEYISSKKIGCKTLFATHYHELICLENELPDNGIKNFSIAVKKVGENIRFLRKIVSGGVDDSYGIEVAKLAGLPTKVISRAKELLSEMESQQPKAAREQSDQLSFTAIAEDEVVERIRKTNVAELSAEEAKEFLAELASLL